MSDTLDTPDGIGIAADAYDPNTPGALLRGTRHILEDGEPLCGNPTVAGRVKSGSYHSEATEYPLAKRELCETCARAYLSKHGSQDETFALLPTLKKGDWVKVETVDGETITGQVRHTPDEDDYPARRIKLVVSGEPQERWVYGIEEKVKVRVREGEQPVISDDDRALTDVSPIDPPAGNADRRTDATLRELEEIAGDVAETVMACGRDVHTFRLNLSPETDVWGLADRLYERGYTVTGAMDGAERKTTDTHKLRLEADELATPA